MRGIVLLALGVSLVSACSRQEGLTVEESKPVVYTVNYPLAFLAERIAGDTIDVVFPDMEGDPAFWKPAAEEVSVYQQADLILLNGATYAKWVPAVSLPQNRLLNTATGLEDRFIPLDDTVTHTHGPGGAHVHGDMAFTLWLDPELAMHQAEAIHVAFEEQWGIDRKGLEVLRRDLAELDASLADAFSPLGDQPILGSHPVYQYLARRYDLNMRSVHWEPDAEPDEALWRELEDILEAHNAKVMLWEDEPLPEVRAALLQKGVVSVVFNPCGNRPEQGDYMDVMRRNVNALNDL